MKIGIDARLFQSPRLGGMGRYLFFLLNEFLQISEHSFVLFEDGRHMHGEFLHEYPQLHYERFVMRGDMAYLWEQLRLPFELSKNKVDLFHSPANTLPLVQPCGFVVTLHDTLLMEHDEDESQGFLFYTRKFLPFALRRAKRVITVSQSSKNDISRFFDINEDKIDVIYHGIDDRFHVSDDEDMILKVLKKYEIEGTFLFSLGSETARKNTERVIEACAGFIAEKRNNCQLVIAGLREKAMEMFRRKIEKRGIANQVRLIGYIPDEELICLYNRAAVFLYLSLYEGFGFPILEAQACGSPVIASNISSMPELIADRRTLADPYDILDIRAKIALVASNRGLREEIVRKGIEKARAFTWRKAAVQTLKVYDKVAPEP